MVRRTSERSELKIKASAPVTVLVDSGRGPKSAGEGTSLTIPFKRADRAIALTLTSAAGATLTGHISGGTAGQPTTKTAPKYVVFWLWTLRADKLKFYDQPNANGRKKPDTPNLSKLAAEGIPETFWVRGTRVRRVTRAFSSLSRGS